MVQSFCSREKKSASASQQQPSDMSEEMAMHSSDTQASSGMVDIMGGSIESMIDTAVPAAPPAVAAGQGRWRAVALNFMQQLQSLGADSMQQLAAGDHSVATHDIFSLVCSDDVRRALPESAEDQAEFLAELAAVVSSVRQVGGLTRWHARTRAMYQ